MFRQAISRFESGAEHYPRSTGQVEEIDMATRKELLVTARGLGLEPPGNAPKPALERAIRDKLRSLDTQEALEAWHVANHGGPGDNCEELHGSMA